MVIRCPLLADNGKKRKASKADNGKKRKASSDNSNSTPKAIKVSDAKFVAVIESAHAENEKQRWKEEHKRLFDAIAKHPELLWVMVCAMDRNFRAMVEVKEIHRNVKSCGGSAGLPDYVKVRQLTLALNENGRALTI